MEQPIKLICFKWPYFWRNWLINNHEDSSRFTWSIWFNIALFFMTLASPLVLMLQRKRYGIIESAFFLALFFGATTFCFIVHFEARYLLPVKFFAVIWILVTFASIDLSLFQRKGKK
jgi:membrane-associated HD superfamily phosphohydrolase